MSLLAVLDSKGVVVKRTAATFFRTLVSLPLTSPQGRFTRYDCRVRHKKMSYDNRRYRQCSVTRVVSDFLHDASSARSRNRMCQS